MKTGKHQIQKLVTLILAIAMLTPMVFTHSKAQEGAEEPIGNRIDAYYEANKNTAAGMQMAVFDNNGIIHKGYYGYADIKNQIPVDESTVIDWGSSTKTLVWVSVMQLWEQGKIDLNADIKAYLPDGFLSNLSYEKPITMIDLMNHRAGFQEYYTDIFIPVDESYLSLEQALLQDPPPQIFEPDTITAYSNWGVALAGYIVERISGESFCDYVHQHIFAPLNMNNTALAPDLSDNPKVKQKRNELVCYAGTKPLGTAFYMIQLYPAGSCVSTLDDYIAYASCFVKDEFPLFENQSTFDVMMSATSYFGNSNVAKNAHGFWALRYGSNTWGHGGNTAGCSSYIYFDTQKKLGAVVMTNQAGEQTFNDYMMELVFGESPWKYDAPNQLPSNMVRPARTILKGHCKIAGEGFLKVNTFQNMLWTYNENNGIPKIENAYGDYYFVSAGEVIPGLIAVFGLAAAVLFSLIVLIFKLIIKIIRIVKKNNIQSAEKWSVLSAFIQLLIGISAIAILILITGWFKSTTYLWLFKAIAILGITLAFLAIHGLIYTYKNWKQTSFKIKLYHLATILFSILTVFTIIYEHIW